MFLLNCEGSVGACIAAASSYSSSDGPDTYFTIASDSLSSNAGVVIDTSFPWVMIKSDNSTSSLPRSKWIDFVSGFRVNLKVSWPFSWPYSTWMLNLLTPNPVNLIFFNSSPWALKTLINDLATSFPTACDSWEEYFLVSSSSFSVLGSTNCTSIPLSVYFLISVSAVPFFNSTDPFSTSSNFINFFIL